jgi:hypothetical protein
MHWAQIVVDRVTANNRGETPMHVVRCPHCTAGTKMVVFVVAAVGLRPIFLGKYSSCNCRLTETDRQQLAAEARRDASVI